MAEHMTGVIFVLRIITGSQQRGKRQFVGNCMLCIFLCKNTRIARLFYASGGAMRSATYFRQGVPFAKFLTLKLDSTQFP